MEKIKALIHKLADANFDCGEFEEEDPSGQKYHDLLAQEQSISNQLIKEIEKLAKGLRAVESLIGESEGVVGYHKNSDVATWEELRAGGRCEALTEFDEALRALE